MTSIISPWAYAAQLAGTAQASLTQASTLLKGPRPFEPTPIHIGIPEQNGPDSPDNPWFVAPTSIAPNNGAARMASAAIIDIQRALNIGTSLSTDIRAAFSSALTAAQDGVQLLTAGALSPTERNAAPLRFDAAVQFLSEARNLLSLKHGTMPVVPDTPFTTHPYPEPIKIQLPDPTSPIQ